jgi:hypothetical protein
VVNVLSSRRGRGLGLAAVLVSVVALVVMTAGASAASSGSAGRATSRAGNGASFTGTRGTLHSISSTKSIPHGLQLNTGNFACLNMTDLPVPADCTAPADDETRPAPNSPFNGGPKGAHHGKGPKVNGNARSGAGGLLANFNAVNDADNIGTIGGHVTPPDQGLCVGPAGALEGAGVPLGVPGNTSVVVEPVNQTWRVYSTSGTTLFGPDNLADLFSDPFSAGDVSCNYDPATQTFFFTEIGAVYVDGVPSFYGTGIAVLNAHGYAAYGADTAQGGECFPDFPQHGFDDNAFYIAINEFCGPTQDDFEGSNLYAISKSQLASLSSSVNFAEFDGISLDGVPVLTLRPAIGDGTSTEYLLNSVAYDAAGNPVDVADTLGFWQVDGDQNITGGSGAVTLTGRSIGSEQYGFPVPAASTGDGSCTVLPGRGCVITSEQYLNPDDSRLEQVQFVSGKGPTRLYTSLNTAMTVGDDPTPVDGAAWFDVNPKTGKINHQGYVGVAGTYLLYPSIVRSGSGTLMLGFSMTSPTLNPSTGYTLSKNEGNSFGPVQTTGAGSGPHLSFSDILFDEPRWGDYSAIAFDPSNGNVWMADEYIPPADEGGSDPVDNWGTRVWALSP